MGIYNPYFDVRPLGDPTNSGFYKFHSPMQVFDLGSTTVALGLQALTPDLYPGLHWRINDSCWMSVGVSSWNFLTCSWQY